ncbi:MAG: PIN domain-containing protein [Candidatus Accumulibacter sp.]|jgi:predicted nucleic acid-binding protein|nr:PIN domain-containing protein [Accumulibacter sp.]
MREVLLDANMLIGAFDHDPKNPTHVQARKELRALLDDPGVLTAITPLVSFEVLRKPTRVSADELEAKLKPFHNFPISEKDACLATKLFRRFSEVEGKPECKNLERLSMDIFHCVCAELNDLEIISNDSDIPKIQQLIQESTQNA